MLREKINEMIVSISGDDEDAKHILFKVVADEKKTSNLGPGGQAKGRGD